MRWMKAIVITLLVIVCGIAPGKVGAAGEACCSSSECPCFSSDGSCTATCADASAFCGAAPYNIIDGTCAQTYTNPTELCLSGWDDWSACENGYKTRLCRNPWQLQVNTCVGGGGTAECTGRTDNCPVNWTPAPNMPLAGVNPNPYCRRGTYCPPPGNAQILTGCCQSDPTDPTNPCIVGEYKTVQCCPPGTAEGYTDTVSSNYTYTHSCFEPQRCANPTDIWISDGRDTSSLCYVAENNCVEQKNGDIDCEYTNIYELSTTCTRVTRTYSCVSTCDTTAPTGVLVTNEPTVGTSVTINWQKGANGWGQFLWVDESSDSEVVDGCPTVGDCEASLFLDAGITSQVVYGLQPLTQYDYRIVTYKNATCHTSVNGTFTTPASSGAISGIVYLDASNTCDETSTLNNVNVVLDGVTTDNTDPAGAFSFTGLSLNSSHSLAVSLTNGYICSTSPACSAYPCTVGGVVSPDSSRRFYLTQNQGSWWQAEGATVYTGGSTGVTVGSTIPASIPDLDRYLIVGGALGSLSSGSILRSSATAASLGAGGASVEGYQARTIYRGDRANYSYFKNEMGLLTTTDSLLNLDTKPTDGAAFHYIDHATTLGDSLGTPWTVDADEKYVIFVNGDLDINVDITVAPGGFAAFIVNGSINVSPDVENIQGMFVANQNFNTVSNGTVDTQLTVEGSVVAWGDVSLDRDLVANNSNSPAEKFVYRPDLLISMPDEMKSFVMQWREVVPGTYDEQ